MKRDRVSVLFLLPLFMLAACAEDDPTGVILEVRYGPNYDGDQAAPGDPVPGADVRISGVPTAEPPEAPEYASGSADAEGRFTVEDIEAVEVFIHASEPGGLGPADCEWYGSQNVTLLNEGETIELELDGQACT